MMPDVPFPVRLDQSSFFPTLDARQPPSLVVFTAPACGACKRVRALLTQLIAGDPPLEGLALYEVEAEASPGLVAELEVFHLPAMFLYSGGDFHAEVHAEARTESLRAGIVAAFRGPRQEPP